MSVADEYGLDDHACPLLAEARPAWERWCAADPDLAVVDDLSDLRAWTRQANVEDKVMLMRTLASLTATDRSAVAALVWLLIPGACRIAASLRDLSPDIDALVASELWVQASGAHRLRTPWLAQSVLNATRREVTAGLGIGSRADRHWKRVLLLGDDVSALVRDQSAAAASRAEPEGELDELFEDAVHDGVITEDEIDLLRELAVAAETIGAPLRGRMGLTTPAAVDRVANGRVRAARTLRRRAGDVLDRLKAYASAGAENTGSSCRCVEAHDGDSGVA